MQRTQRHRRADLRVLVARCWWPISKHWLAPDVGGSLTRSPKSVRNCVITSLKWRVHVREHLLHSLFLSFSMSFAMRATGRKITEWRTKSVASTVKHLLIQSKILHSDKNTINVGSDSNSRVENQFSSTPPVIWRKMSPQAIRTLNYKQSEIHDRELPERHLNANSRVPKPPMRPTTRLWVSAAGAELRQCQLLVPAGRGSVSLRGLCGQWAEEIHNPSKRRTDFQGQSTQFQCTHTNSGWSICKCHPSMAQHRSWLAWSLTLQRAVLPAPPICLQLSQDRRNGSFPLPFVNWCLLIAG